MIDVGLGIVVISCLFKTSFKYVFFGSSYSIYESQNGMKPLDSKAQAEISRQQTTIQATKQRSLTFGKQNYINLCTFQDLSSNVLPTLTLLQYSVEMFQAKHVFILACYVCKGQSNMEYVQLAQSGLSPKLMSQRELTSRHMFLHQFKLFFCFLFFLVGSLDMQFFFLVNGF